MTPSYILVLYLDAKEFLRNMCFPLSNGQLYLHFSYLYNGNWNFQIAITDLLLLWDPINWLKIWMFYTFLTNSVQTPAGTLLYSTWLQMNFWEICVFHWVMDIWNCTFPISTIEIENYNGCKSLNMALGSHNLTWFGCLRPSSATWWRHWSGRDDSQLCSCTLPGCKRNLEKYVFYTEYWTISIAFFLSLQRELKFSNGYNWLIIALGTWQTLYPNRYILVLYLDAREILDNMCFALSGGHLKLNLFYLYNGNWNFQMAKLT